MLPTFGIRSFVKRSLGLAGRTSLQVGDVAPELDSVDVRGKRWTLADLRGQRAVIYFYPKDDTPGCTREACEFRDQGADLGATVLGISTDGAEAARIRARFRRYPGGEQVIRGKAVPSAELVDLPVPRKPVEGRRLRDHARSTP